MALFPQGLTAVDARCNAGERRVLHQLKRCLEDDYLVWHDIPIGARARQPDFIILSPRWGVLLLEVKSWRRSTLGAATRDAVELNTARGRVTQPHPLRQARDYTMELVDLMKADPALVHATGPFAGRLLFPYGWGVVFSGLKRADVHTTDAASDFDELFPPSRTLLRDELEDTVSAADFQSRLWGMFTVSYPHTLTLPQRDRIRWHLFPDIRLPTQGTLDLDGAKADAAVAADTEAAATTQAPPPLPSLLQVMDLQQEQVARTLGEGHRVIHGAAGSGKTMILIFRAQFLATIAKPGQPILVLCFNRTLATRIEAQLRQRGVDERVQVRTFHSWCQDMVRSYQLTVPAGLQGDAYFEALAQVLQRAVDNGRVPGGQYSALLIDEAHDFEDAWLAMAARMVSPATNSLLVLYDDAQSIYQTQRRNFSFASVGIQARGRTSVLRMNYRNTAEVLALAVQCAQHLLLAQGPGAGPHGTDPSGTDSKSTDDNPDDHLQRVSPASAGRRGPLPVLLQARDALEEAQWLADNLAAAHAEGLPLHGMAVLCRTRAQMWPIADALARTGLPVQSMASPDFRQFDWHANAIKLVTLHSAKGLEFAHVCIAGLQAWPLPGESMDDALRLLYVGMTRATQRLVLSAHSGGREGAARELVQRVQRALQTVSTRFFEA